MNLIKEICSYYKFDMPGQLSFTAQSLYMAILHTANDTYSRHITPSNGLLMAKTGIKDIKTLEKARQELIDLELITYKSNAKSRLAGNYEVLGLERLLVDNFQKKSGKNPEYTQENFRIISGKISPHIQEKNREENILENTTPKEEKTDATYVPYQKILDLYHSICVSLPKVRTLTATRKKHTKARYSENNNNIVVFEELFKRAEQSDFLTGRIKSNNPKYGKFKANYDWLLNETNMAKVLEDRYANNKSSLYNELGDPIPGAQDKTPI